MHCYTKALNNIAVFLNYCNKEVFKLFGKNIVENAKKD